MPDAEAEYKHGWARLTIPRFPHRPLVVAHRGDAAHHPENTLPAFLAAADAGADMVELDVRLSADGVPVVRHDADVSSTTDGTGLVRGLSLAELKRLDASGGRGPRAEIPTLQEVVRAMGERGVGLDLEIKNIPGEPDFDSPEERALEATLGVLGDAGFDGPLIVSSFNWLTIERCRELAPEIPTGFLTLAAIDPRAGLDYVRGAGHTWVLPAAPELLGAGEPFVGEAHAAGVRVGTWTVDDPEAQRALISWGVDLLITNDPAAAVAIRASGEE